MRTLFQDLRYAARLLTKAPVLTLIVVVTVALGVGANSACFSVVYALLMRPVEMPELEHVAMIQERQPGGQFEDSTAPRTYADWLAETRSFSRLCAYQWWSVTLGGQGDPEPVIADQVSPGFFELAGMPPALGRTFAPDEVEGRQDHVAVLSDRLWRRHYGGDRSIVGRAITINGESYTVVGVMPRNFRFPNAAELWAPLVLSAEQKADRGTRYLGVIGRLRPGATMEQANAEMSTLGERHAELYPATDAGRPVRAVPLAYGIVEDLTRAFIWLLMGAAAFVLCVACANVANLLLARSTIRRREMAVRVALGAGRWRIMRQLLTESALLGLLGGGGAVMVAAWAVDVVRSAIPASTTRFIPGWEHLSLNPAVLSFTLVIAVGTGLIFGLAPSLAAASTDVTQTMKDGGRGTTSARGTHRLRGALVVLQVALSVVLLAGAGAMVRGFVHRAYDERGVDPRGVLTLRVDLLEARYAGKSERIIQFEQQALERLAALPGVEAASATNNIPWGNYGAGRSIAIAGRPEARPGETPTVEYRTVSPSYLPLLRVPLRAGRQLGPADDRPDAQPVVLVSAATVRRYFGGQDPVGQRLRFGRADDPGPWRTIVGVVGDVSDRADEREPRPTVYVPFGQKPSFGIYFALRTSGDPRALTAAARAVIHAVDPEQSVAQERTLGEVLTERLSGVRLGAGMMASFALLALILAVIGIYGVISYGVAQRSHEFGIRMALGARERDVVGMVVRGGARLVAVALVIGIPVALGLLRLMTSTFADIVDGSPLLMGVLTLLVSAMALAGTWLPARRATRVDPMVALRSD
jgi:predicted permease